MQPVPTAPTAAEDGGLSTHVLHMTRLHAKRPLLVELRVINGPFEGGCRLQSGAGAWLACNTSGITLSKERISPVPQVRARPEEMRCVGSKRTRELGRDMLLAASIVESSVAKAHGRNRTVF